MSATAVAVPPCGGTTPGPVVVTENPATVVVGAPAETLQPVFRALASTFPATGETAYVVALPVRAKADTCGLAVAAGVLETSGVIPEGATAPYLFWGATDGDSVFSPHPPSAGEELPEGSEAVQPTETPGPVFSGARKIVCPAGTPGMRAQDIGVRTVGELAETLGAQMTLDEFLTGNGWRQTAFVPTSQYHNAETGLTISWDGQIAEIWGGVRPVDGQDIGIVPEGGQLLDMADATRDDYEDLVAAVAGETRVSG